MFRILTMDGKKDCTQFMGMEATASIAKSNGKPNKRISKIKLLPIVLAAQMLPLNNAQAARLSAHYLYLFARQGNERALAKYASWINLTDEQGNTALCKAYSNGDNYSYYLLKKYGASERTRCMQQLVHNRQYGQYANKAPTSTNDGTFLGMGTTGWLTTGAIVAAGAGIAVAAGGGGGGGGSSSGSGNGNGNGNSGNTGGDGDSGNTGGNWGSVNNASTEYLDNEVITDTDNGDEIIGKSIAANASEDNAVNNGTIKKIVQSQSDVSGIATESEFTGNAFSIGGRNSADIVIAQRDSGDVSGIKAPRNMINSEGEVYNAMAEENGAATGNITIRNTGAGSGDIYGMQVEGDTFVGNAISDSSAVATGNILIENVNSNKNVYGIRSVVESLNAEAMGGAKAYGNITIRNEGNGDVYGIQTFQENTGNAGAAERGETVARIDINNKGNGNVFGVTTLGSYDETKGLYNARSGFEGDYVPTANATGTINITNTGTGNVYGAKSLTNVYNAYSDYNRIIAGKIRISNNGSGDAYGLFGNSLIANAYTYSENSSRHPTATGYVNILNKSSGNAYGLYSNVAGNEISNESGTNGKTQQSVVEMANISDGLAVGLYSKNGTVNNSGDIKIHNLADGVAVGIYADGSTNVTNSGTITIDRSTFIDDMATNDTSDDVPYSAETAKGGKAIGIYGASGSTITNSGTIKISDANEAYGIYSEGSNVVNTGTILIDGNNNHENAIRLNGGQLFQNGRLISTNSINLADMGGDVIASATTEIVTPEALSGSLKMSKNIVSEGFKQTYTTEGTIKAGDTSGLNLKSQSALFDAKLAENGTDVKLSMKSFGDVVKDDSVAGFLQSNYAAQNNEKLFSALKSAETVASLNSSVDSLFGKEMFSRMAFEDISMLREINFDMNQNLFNQEKGYFAFGENISPSSYDNNIGSIGRYSLNGHNDGKRSFAIGMSIADIRTNSGNNDNNKFDRSFMMSAPYGYRADNGFEFITTPKLGFTYGTYRRTGLDGMNYNGDIQKRMFALMHETRHPFNFSNMTLTPTLEFNAIGYNIKGSEDDKDYSLNIKSQNNMSIETGFGLTASKELNLTKDSKLKLNGGVSLYHEFANPYELELGMRGMSGTYKMRNDKYGDNRAVVRCGFDYQLQDSLNVTASFLSNIDKEVSTDASFEVKYRF